MAERDLQTDIRLAVGSRPNVTLFRNNTGMGWAGEVIRSYNNGNKELKNCRPLHTGLCTGSSDLIGWTTKVITPDMVGQKVAVFTAVEVKLPNGKEREAQLNFVQQVQAAGGIAGFCRSSSQAIALVDSAPGVGGSN